MESLAAGGFQEADQIQFFQQGFHQSRRLDHLCPGDRRIGIQVECQAIRSIETITCRAPGMEFQHTHLHQSEYGIQRISDHVGGSPVIIFLDLETTDGLRHPFIDVFLIETALIAFRTTKKRQWSTAQMRKNPFPDLLVVTGKVVLREPEIGVEHPVGMSQTGARAGRHRAFGWSVRFEMLTRSIHRDRLWLFFYNLSCRLVRSETLKAGLSQNSLLCPFCKPHFRHQIWLHPVHAADFRPRRRVGKGRARAFTVSQCAVQLPQRSFRKSCPHFPRVPKPVPLIVADKECSKTTARTGWLGESSDHEFLTLLTFDFEPTAAPSGPIGQIRPLGDQTLEPVSTSFLKRRTALTFDVIAVTKQTIPMSGMSGYQGSQHMFPIGQGA